MLFTLVGVKQDMADGDAMSASDPKRTSAPFPGYRVGLVSDVISLSLGDGRRGSRLSCVAVSVVWPQHGPGPAHAQQPAMP